MLDIAGIKIQEIVYLLREYLLKFTHACREIKVKMSRKQAVAFVRPRQRDFVEVLTDLASQRPQVIEPAGAAQQLLVVAAGADRCPVLAGNLIVTLRSCLTAVQMLIWIASSMVRSVIIAKPPLMLLTT